MQGSIHSRDEFRDGQNGLKGSVQSAIERRDFGESFSLDDLICTVLGDAPVDEDLCSLRSLVDGMVDEGVLESFPDGCLKRVPPVPKHERLSRQDRRLRAVGEHGPKKVRLGRIDKEEPAPLREGVCVTRLRWKKNFLSFFTSWCQHGIHVFLKMASVVLIGMKKLELMMLSTMMVLLERSRPRLLRRAPCLIGGLKGFVSVGCCEMPSGMRMRKARKRKRRRLMFSSSDAW